MGLYRPLCCYDINSHQASKIEDLKKTYDWCIANKMVNNKQLTMVWHVNYLRIFHDNHSAVGKLINNLSKRYGKEADLNTHEERSARLSRNESGILQI